MHSASLIAVMGIGLGCGPGPDDATQGPRYDPRLPDPIPVQQRRAYPEAQTGVFLSLADFENAPDSPAGAKQLEHFSIRSGPNGPAQPAQPRFVLNITRTGAGALAARMQPGSTLRYDVPHVRDWSGYMLLSMAVHTEADRDDLRIRLISKAGSYTAPLRLCQAGWTAVAVDLRSLAETEAFDLRNVQAVEISLANPGRSVRLGLDDILLIDNRRRIQPSPEKLTLRRRGLDWLIDWAAWDRLLVLEESPDGLYRFKRTQTHLQVLGPDQQAQAAGESLAALGTQRVGQVNLLESNPLRVRLEQVWYFPDRRGQWARTGVRSVRWLHTLYKDGRWVSHLEINNAAGPTLAALRIDPPFAAAFAGTQAVRDRLDLPDFAGPIGRFSWQMVSGANPSAAALQAAYLQPGKAHIAIAEKQFFAPGDVDRDRFDQSQGCWSFRADGGHCRFRLSPPPEGLADPVIQVDGLNRQVAVSVEGRAIRDVVTIEPGRVLFQLPGPLLREVWVELTSRP
ncbi:MAG: hypothetical protein ACLFUJ_07985 [Phycisphaerae bacterium]